MSVRSVYSTPKMRILAGVCEVLYADRVYLPWVYWGRKNVDRQKHRNMKILLRSEENRKTFMSVLYSEIELELLYGTIWNPQYFLKPKG